MSRRSVVPTVTRLCDPLMYHGTLRPSRITCGTGWAPSMFDVMLAADPDFQVLAYAPPGRDGELDELSHTLLVEHAEWIVGKYTLLDVIREKAARVVPTETKRSLCQIVGAERKELGGLGNF